MRRSPAAALLLAFAACSSQSAPGADHPSDPATSTLPTPLATASTTAAQTSSAAPSVAPTVTASAATAASAAPALDPAPPVPTAELDAGVVYKPVSADALRTDLCQAPALASARERLKKSGFPHCMDGVYPQHVRLTINGKVLLVAGAINLRPTWGDAPPQAEVRTFVDDQLIEGDSPWTVLGKLPTLSAPQTQALLQGAALVRGAHKQLMTLAQADEQLANWPEALADVKASPPGMSQDAAGTWLRVYEQHGFGGRGGSCSFLDRYVVHLDRAEGVTVHTTRVRTSGSMASGPCT